jgi:long-subunit acyl-CoA synthetase (AMP-forming)
MARHHVTTIIGVPRFYDVFSNTLRERISSSVAGRALFAALQALGSPALARRAFGAVHRKFGGRLRVLVSGGAALNVDTGRTLTTLGFQVCEGFGMTECAPMITFPRFGKEKLGSCGQALTGCEVRIVDGEIKETYAIVARELGVPIVPVVIDGAHRVLAPGQWFPRLLRRVSVTYLDPVVPSGGQSADDLNRRVHGMITQELIQGRRGDRNA